MKQSIILILIIIKSNLIFSQKSIMPNENTDFCPLVNTTFTITIPLIKPNSTVTLSAIGTPTIITGVTGLSSNATSTTFTFIGRFSDDNNTQSFRVDFTKSDNSSDFYISEFKKIKSLKHPSIPSTINTNIPEIVSQICQITTHNLTFTNIRFGNGFDGSVVAYGNSVTQYEYLLPNGWSLNGTPSTGSWITSTNSVTITSDQTGGDRSSIQIRALNTDCGTSLSKSPIKNIPISRPEPPLSITGPTQLCYPNSYNYTLSGVPSGGVITWNTNSYYTSSSSGNTATILPTSAANGVTNITASVYLPSCGLTFTKSFTVSIGAPYVTFDIVGYPYSEPNCYETYGIYTFQAQQATGYPNTYTGFEWGWRNLTTNTVSSDPTIYGSGYTFFPEEAGTYQIWVRPTNQCGSGALESVKIITVNNFCYSFRSGITASSVLAFPNPTKDVINLTVTSKDKSDKFVRTNKVVVVLFEAKSALKVREWKFENQQKTYTLNVKGLKKGIYYLRYMNGNKRETKQIIIE